MSAEAQRWEDRPVAVIGLGRTGVAAARLLRRLGARPLATDDAPDGPAAPALHVLKEAGGRFFPPDGRGALWEEADLCVASPGVPWRAPVLEEARRAGLEVISELELASRFVRGSMVAVTGTNGKSTTTALTAHLLEACGLRAPAGGNLGTPLSDLLEQDGPEVHHVVECSSFQLMGCTTFRPRVAVLLNVTPDHLDWHASMEEYVEAKRRIFLRQQAGDTAVWNARDSLVAGIVAGVRADLLPFGLSRRSSGGRPSFWVEEEALWTDLDGEARAWCPAAEVPLAGPHNLENVMASAAAAATLGCPLERLREALPSFRALPHRMERVLERRGVAFVDDSKATNVAAARCAVLSFAGGLHLVLGGRDKGGDWEGLRADLGGRVRRIYLLGEAAGLIAGALEGVAPMQTCASIEEAVSAAWAEAGPGDTVLLAPGCASQDMFRDYAERGEVFAAAARGLAGAPAGRGR